jgi:hypothetical protein
MHKVAKVVICRTPEDVILWNSRPYCHNNKRRNRCDGAPNPDSQNATKDIVYPSTGVGNSLPDKIGHDYKSPCAPNSIHMSIGVRLIVV